MTFRRRGEKYSGAYWELSLQSVEEYDDKFYDVLVFRVTALADKDWDFLKKDWEQNRAFEHDEEGKAIHLQEKQARTVFYDSPYYFDISSFYRI